MLYEKDKLCMTLQYYHLFNIDEREIKELQKEIKMSYSKKVANKKII